MTQTMFKQIGAVLAGFFTVAILSLGTDVVMRWVGVLPSLDAAMYSGSALGLALAYRSAFAVLGGYVTAALAPKNARQLVFILGCLGTVGGIAGVAVGWNMPNIWYPLGILIGAYPLTWLGGKLRLSPQQEQAHENTSQN